MAERGKVDCRIKPSEAMPDGPPRPIRSQPLKCPECGSAKTWKDGLRYLNDGRSVQRYVCRLCGFRFSEPTAQLKVKVNVGAQPLKIFDSVNDHFEVSGSLACVKKPFNDSPFTFSENVSPHSDPNEVSTTTTLKYNGIHNRYYRVCASEEEAKNSASKAIALAEEKALSKKWAAGATLLPLDIKGKLVEFAWWLKKQATKIQQ